MANNLPVLDRTLLTEVNKAEESVEQKLDCQLMFFFGEIRSGRLTFFRNFVEQLVRQPTAKKTLAICLTTPGGEVEPVEKMVDIVRHHYEKILFIVPGAAFSAGTIFCMSGDKIFMDYSSSLGPIDPQVPDKENKYLVPALGYLDKVDELVQKSKSNTISPGELAILVRQDLAMLRFYEQAKDLSIALLKQWLATYKFKDWVEHRTRNIGQPVTREEKEARAEEIANMLCDNKKWHSHGRMIGLKTLREHLHLEIEDFGENAELSEKIRLYNDVMSDYVGRSQIDFFVYNRDVSILGGMS